MEDTAPPPVRHLLDLPPEIFTFVAAHLFTRDLHSTSLASQVLGRWTAEACRDLWRSASPSDPISLANETEDSLPGSESPLSLVQLLRLHPKHGPCAAAVSRLREAVHTANPEVAKAPSVENVITALHDYDDALIDYVESAVAELASRPSPVLSRANRQAVRRLFITEFMGELQGYDTTPVLWLGTREFLSDFLIRQWDAGKLYDKLLRWTGPRCSSRPPPHCIGEAMHESARVVYGCLSAILSFGVCPVDDVNMREALSLARASVHDRGAAFQLAAHLPEPGMDIATCAQGEDEEGDGLDGGEADPLVKRINSRWRILAVDKSKCLARVKERDHKVGVLTSPRVFDVTFLPETMGAVRPGHLVSGFVLTRLMSAAPDARVTRFMGDVEVWPRWLNSFDVAAADVATTTLLQGAAGR